MSDDEADLDAGATSQRCKPRRGQKQSLAYTNHATNEVLQLRKQIFEDEDGGSLKVKKHSTFVPARPTENALGLYSNPLMAGNTNKQLFGKQNTDTGKQGAMPSAPFLNSDEGTKAFGWGREEINATTYYEGQFKYSQRWGEGTLHNLETGSKYVGQFSADRFHGEGHHWWADGTEYLGQWKNGEKSGKGKFISADYLTYTGQWVRGRRHGYGVQAYSNGDKYEGNWKDGFCSGSGVYTWANGNVYKGTWSNGRYDGPGVFKSKDGKPEHRTYRNGLLERRDVTVVDPRPSSKSPRKRGPFAEHVIQEREPMHSPTRLPPLAPTKHPVKYCRGDLRTPRGSYSTQGFQNEGIDAPSSELGALAQPQDLS
eukprot:gnl/MRDRNA2_/MRDRNA2_101610_c0_seq1.p1 gnl/MRDRNA2_/MRDRNA2_101610_c0~~gnl/MRDRNA2_/MRDRNA2_101610_c0_seq1.p1  ORF type:complete len:396 (-),score=51.95 gnl/MRDRNA2_/MRDRNA2_101610_c0_seq1:125-1231(-)